MPGGPFPDFGDPLYDPFSNPDNRIEFWRTKHPHPGQLNRKIVSGPDAGLHQGYDMTKGSTFQSTQDPFRGR
jgi:hypothetical protein